MARAYLDFRDAGRKWIMSGQPVDEVLGPREINLDLFLRRRAPGDPHSASTWACDFTGRFADVDVFVRLAWTFSLARFMRVIVPTRCSNGYPVLICIVAAESHR